MEDLLKQKRSETNVKTMVSEQIWHAREDSNLQPSEPESDALSIALRTHIQFLMLINDITKKPPLSRKESPKGCEIRKWRSKTLGLPEILPEYLGKTLKVRCEAW